MQMLQDGPYATAPEKPLRMTGSTESCRVRIFVYKYCFTVLRIVSIQCVSFPRFLRVLTNVHSIRVFMKFTIILN